GERSELCVKPGDGAVEIGDLGVADAALPPRALTVSAEVEQKRVIPRLEEGGEANQRLLAVAGVAVAENDRAARAPPGRYPPPRKACPVQCGEADLFVLQSQRGRSPPRPPPRRVCRDVGRGGSDG